MIRFQAEFGDESSQEEVARGVTDEVARLALDNIADGPVYISSEHYREMFDNLLQMPRRDALMAMADNMRRHT